MVGKYKNKYKSSTTQQFTMTKVASALALGVATGLVNAQTSTDDASDEGTVVLEELVVTGYRRSIENNLATKRNSNSFVDAITAEDIGKFPDKNVADALQRVPGVSITRDGGEGSAVSVRGFGPGLTLTQLNGNYIASTPGEPSRSFDFNLLPATMKVALVARSEYTAVARLS